MGETVRRARAEDAFAVAALHIQCEREHDLSCPHGYLDAFADAWIADRARLGWLAEAPDGTPLGVAHGTVVTRLPSPRRPGGDAWLLVSLLFVTPAARHTGLGERLIRALLDSAAAEGVTRVQLHAEPAARSLYEQIGFGPPSERLLEMSLRRAAGDAVAAATRASLG